LLPSETMDKLSTFVLANLLFAPILTAQSVQASLRALTPLQATARSGTSIDAQVLPVGPLPTFGEISAVANAGGPSVSAASLWDLTVSPVAVELSLGQLLEIDAATTGALGECSNGPHDFILDVVSTANPGIPVLVSVESRRRASPGFPSPTYEIDVGNDGSIEFLSTFSGSGSVSRTLGANTLPIRIRLAGQHSATQGYHLGSDSIRVTVTPQNFLAIQPAIFGCETASAYMLPAFSQSGVLFGVGNAAGPAVAVFGLGVQPVILPNSSSLLQCLLIPSPDAVLLLPPTGYQLGLPMAVRPITIYAQAVLLLPAGLGTSNGFIVQG